jgi:5-methylcytosine-specific restriction endonuclease McrA
MTREQVAYNRHQHYLANRDRLLDRSKRWGRDNKERKLKYQREYYAKNRERIRVEQKAYRQDNPEVDRNLRRLKRVRRKELGVIDLTTQEWLEVLECFDYCCAYCFQSGVGLTQDHVVPISKGGNHTKSNVVPACVTCNSSKHARDLNSWLWMD